MVGGQINQSNQNNWKQLITLTPDKTIQFYEQLDNKTRLIIRNGSEEHITFKIKVTDLESYVVKPNFGVIKPKEWTEVEISTSYNISTVRVSVFHYFLGCKKDHEIKVSNSDADNSLEYYHRMKLRVISFIFIERLVKRILEKELYWYTSDEVSMRSCQKGSSKRRIKGTFVIK